MKRRGKTGDEGETSLIGGRRVSKDDARVACYGEVDELNAVLGLAGVLCADEYLPEVEAVQRDLFVLGAQLATPEGRQPPQAIEAAHVATLERRIDEVEAGLTSVESFILPGGDELAARLHHARTVCRRVERSVVALAGRSSVDSLVIVYLNRLGDLLFALARRANHRARKEDITWNAP